MLNPAWVGITSVLMDLFFPLCRFDKPRVLKAWVLSFSLP